jgi:uncharacterized protein YciI
MKFAVIADYQPDDPKIPEVRPVHRQYLTELIAKGKLVISGPFPEVGGALIVLEADSKDEAEALVKADPFTQAGVFTSYVIYPWNPIFINRSLLPE